MGNSRVAIMIAAFVSIVAVAPAAADPGGNGNGNGNAHGYGFGKGNGNNSNNSSRGGPIPLLGATLLGQAGLAAGAMFLWRRRRPRG